MLKVKENERGNADGTLKARKERISRSRRDNKRKNTRKTRKRGR